MRLRHSLFWKLAGVLALFCLLLVALYADLGRRINEATQHLSVPVKATLSGYARQAERAWREEGSAGLDVFLDDLRAREGIWAVVVDSQQRSLSSHDLDDEERSRLHFMRRLDWSVGRPGGRPTFYMPFEQADGRLVMELPHRLNPRSEREIWDLLVQRIMPVMLALLLGLVLYRSLIAPLGILRRQAQALSVGDLSARSGARVARRKDELGELARTFDHMAERLGTTVEYQRRLLRDLSHELRTPLSRLRVASETTQDVESMRQRLERELQCMDQLIGDTLELVWLDTERPNLPLAPIDIGRLWDVLRENACFESGWSLERLPCELPADCRVLGHLNGLAQALENILRNAIRHSPEDGVVRLTGRREGPLWHLWIEDQGSGVEEAELERIFQPFSRLNAARPGGEGFGLGLSIARSVLHSQGGAIWAESALPGLRVHLTLPAS